MTLNSASVEQPNAVWLYLGKEARTPDEVDAFLVWCRRNRVGRVLVHMDLLSEHQEAVHGQLTALIDACRAAGVEVHAMISALIQRTGNRDELLLQDREAYCVDVHGISSWDEPVSGTAYTLDPGKPQVIEAIRGGALRLLERFPALSGLHLDFVRYYYFDSVLSIDTKSAGHWLGSVPKPGQPIRLETPNGGRTTFFVEAASNAYNDPPIGDRLTLRREYRFCFCDACVGGFLTHSGVQPPPEQAAGVAERARWVLREHGDAWHAYRAGLVTALIGTVRRALQEARPDAKLSATIWYNAPYGHELRGEPLEPGSVDERFGQRWEDWAAQGLVDFLCPMDYWLAPDSFAGIVREQTAAAGAVPVYPGILNSGEYALNAEQYASYEAAAREAGAPGVTFFHYGSWKAVL